MKWKKNTKKNLQTHCANFRIHRRTYSSIVIPSPTISPLEKKLPQTHNTFNFNYIYNPSPLPKIQFSQTSTTINNVSTKIYNFTTPHNMPISYQMSSTPIINRDKEIFREYYKVFVLNSWHFSFFITPVFLITSNQQVFSMYLIIEPDLFTTIPKSIAPRSRYIFQNPLTNPLVYPSFAHLIKTWYLTFFQEHFSHLQEFTFSLYPIFYIDTGGYSEFLHLFNSNFSLTHFPSYFPEDLSNLVQTLVVSPTDFYDPLSKRLKNTTLLLASYWSTPYLNTNHSLFKLSNLYPHNILDSSAITFIGYAANSILQLAKRKGNSFNHYFVQQSQWNHTTVI